MRAGSLRHLVNFQELTVANDSWGHSGKTWADSISAWASIWSLRGSEQMDALKLDNKISHKIRVRYQSGIHPKMRIRFGTRYFNIRSIVNVDERNIYQEIMADEEI